MKTYPSIGVQSPQILLPKPGIDLTKWAAVACDQFTSQPEYWRQAAEFVGKAPSTLHLIFPEVYLEEVEAPRRIERIQAAMRAYLEGGLFTPYDGMVYVERTIRGRTRRGLVLALDLERYDYTPGSSSLIRATEGTILERLPPRVRIRQGASLELPHILVLIDDPGRTVIEPLGEGKDRLKLLYDFDLMLDGGHLSGRLVSQDLEAQVVAALEALGSPQNFAPRYGLPENTPVLLFAMGDGNHSLATAKAAWEQLKPQVREDHPARYALVEVENVHDEALEFEPIHRLLFGMHRELLPALREAYGEAFSYAACAGQDEMERVVTAAQAPADSTHRVGLVTPQGFGVITIAHPASNLPVGSLQPFLDGFLKAGGAEKIDYVHGAEVVCSLGRQPGNAGFFLPGMQKSDLFKTVILDGVLPRKTFSMGEAREKRYYMECRKIT